MVGNRITRCFRHGLAMNLAAPPRNPTISIVGGVKKILKVWMMGCEPQAEPIWLFLNIDPYGFELSDSESWECLERIVKDKEFKVKPVFLTKGKTEREINERLHIKA